MKITDILKDLDYRVISGNTDGEISSLTSDSRRVTSGSAFVCIEGMKADGHIYAADCAGRGAALIVTSKSVDVPEEYGACVVQVEDTRYAFALMSCAFFSYPSRELKVIGVTGTKGKTTTTYMIRHILEHAGHKCGLIGTIEIYDGAASTPAGNTTPESYIVQESLRRMRDNGCDYAVMEVSSQGLMLHRTAGVEFEIGIFTNIEPDHIGEGEHRDFDHYLSCKSLLFSQCKKGIINIDDSHYERILANHTCEVETFGFSKKADYRAADVRLYTDNGMPGVDFALSGELCADIRIGTPGAFSVYNALSAIGACYHLGVTLEDIRDSLIHIRVKGRVEPVEVSPDFTMMIDYAHNAMALKSLLETLREYEPGRLICMFGCGGNRSKLRRYEMGEVSGRYADLTVITSDNPRDEDPIDIIEDIKTGIHKTTGDFIVIPDRREAIKWCIDNGSMGDMIVLAGKGHEDYQEIKGQKYPMDERVIIADILAERNA